MSDPVIPYATPLEGRGLTAAEWFGVIVRTIGLLMLIWGFYTLVYLIIVLAASAPTRGQPETSFVIMSAFWLV